MSHAGVADASVRWSRRVALASLGLAFMSVVLFLLGGVTAGKSIIFCFAGAGLSLLAGIGAVWVGRQGPPPRSSLPAIVVTISLVLLMSFVVTLFYIGSQLRNFANQ